MKTGLYDLDAAIELNGNKLIVLGSRPAMGKSTLALNIISDIAIKQKEAVLYFNLESSKDEIASKFIISNAMVEYTKFRRIKDPKILGDELTEEDWDRIEYGTRILNTSKIFIEDKPNISIDEICIEARKMKLEQNIQFIVIDYLQLIRYEKEKVLDRDLQINKILEKLKKLSQELNIPILVLSQLSREPENRKDHRPRITDFSNYNKSVDMYSDIVLLLYRDEYYNTKTKLKNIAEIIIAKGTAEEMNIEIAWMPEYLKFGNLLRVRDIEEKDIKQIETDYYNKVFVLLNNGNLYRNGELIDNKISKIYMFDGQHLYKITEDNKIRPIYEDDIWDNKDKYLNNNNCSYKKIVTSTLHIVALTVDGDVRAIHGLPTGLGIEPENFKNVEDISIVKETKDIEVPYIFKNKEYKPLYIE